MGKEKLHIAVCLDSGYVMPTGVMMYSVCVNNQDVDIDFHVLIDGSVSERDKQDLRDTLEKFHGKRALFYAVNSMQTIRFPLIKRGLTRATYYRLFLPEILPPSVEKVLYLDGDIIVRHSLLPLWETDMTDFAIGAVMDVCDGDIRIYNRLKYPYTKGYFNAGVLFINLAYWRDNNIVARLIDYIKNYPERILQEDQDVMNAVLQDEKIKLPVCYNFQSGFLKSIPGRDSWRDDSEIKSEMTDPVIVHFSERQKPWYKNLRYSHPFKSTFLKYQSQTKWNGYNYDPRPFILRIRNSVGDLLRIIGIKQRVRSPFIDISPID